MRVPEDIAQGFIEEAYVLVMLGRMVNRYEGFDGYLGRVFLHGIEEPRVSGEDVMRTDWLIGHMVA